MAIAVMPSGIQLTVDALRGPLADLGFRKRAGEIFTTELDDDFLGWLGLNRATAHRALGQVEVNPVVGVRHQGVERVVAELRDAKFHAYEPPTVSTPIGYVMPQHRYASWVIGEHNAEVEAADLMTAVAEHGLAFMRSMVGLPRLRDALDEGLGHQIEYRMPVVLALMDDFDGARDALRRALDGLADREDAAAQQFRHFADAFRSRDWSAR